MNSPSYKLMRMQSGWFCINTEHFLPLGAHNVKNAVLCYSPYTNKMGNCKDIFNEIRDIYFVETVICYVASVSVHSLFEFPSRDHLN